MKGDLQPIALSLRRPAVASGRRPLLLSFVVLVILLFSHAGSAQPPTRIISLVPALTEMLFAIGAGPQVVAVSSYDTDPPEVLSLPKVGALLDPDTERILSLRPDLVLVYGSQLDLLQQLERARVSTFLYRHGGLQDVSTTIKALGGRTGHQASADRLSAAITARLHAIRAAVQGKPRPRTMLVFGRERGTLRGIYASGGRGFLHDMIEAAGGINVFADVMQESVQASTEMILARAPDVVLEVRASEAELLTAADERKTWTRLASLPAVQTGQIHVLTGRMFVVPGPRVAEGAAQFARAIHPGVAP